MAMPGQKGKAYGAMERPLTNKLYTSAYMQCTSTFLLDLLWSWQLRKVSNMHYLVQRTRAYFSACGLVYQIQDFI